MWAVLVADDVYLARLVLLQYGEFYTCPINSDGLTLLDDPESLPQVDMLNNFWTVPYGIQAIGYLLYCKYVCLMNIALYCILICFCH